MLSYTWLKDSTSDANSQVRNDGAAVTESGSHERACVRSSPAPWRRATLCRVTHTAEHAAAPYTSPFPPHHPQVPEQPGSCGPVTARFLLAVRIPRVMRAALTVGSLELNVLIEMRYPSPECTATASDLDLDFRTSMSNTASHARFSTVRCSGPGVH